MTFTVNSIAVFDNKSELKPYVLERRDLLPDDVLIGITHTGICHTDLHVAHNDWQYSVYPLVPGHEIVGVVEKIGDQVTKHKVGDVVAVGCIVDSCQHCAACDNNKEQLCSQVAQTYGFPERRFPRPGATTAGGYSEKIVVQDHFVLSVPKELTEPDLISGVAPIMCAGITTYSPMDQFGLNSTHKVAIIGLGGLGHMGVKIAAAIGAEVTAISRTHRKEEVAKKLGAKHYIASGSPEEMAANADKFDLVIDTIPFDHDINDYIPLVKPEGTLSIVGHLGEFQNKPVNTMALVMGNRKLAGSFVGGIQETQDLLNLCAKHRIIAKHKVIDMEDVNEAWQALIDGDSASRYVIDVKKFRERNAKAIHS